MDHIVKNFLVHLSSIGRSEETIKGYRTDLLIFKRFLVSKYNCEPYVEEITSEDIEEYLVYLNERKGYAPASRQRNLYTLRSFFSYCQKKGWVQRNVALLVEKIKLQQKERSYLTEEEVDLLIQAIDHPLIRLVVTFLYYTGLRISECLNLTLDHVDMDRRVIHVVGGKGNKDRFVPIADRLYPLLLDYLANQRPESDSPLFFCTRKTGMLSPVYVNAVLAETVDKLGWKKKVTAHVLRHSFASQLVKRQVSLVEIQKLLGHSSLKVTGIYTHTDMNQLTKAVNSL